MCIYNIYIYVLVIIMIPYWNQNHTILAPFDVEFRSGQTWIDHLKSQVTTGWYNNSPLPPPQSQPHFFQSQPCLTSQPLQNILKCLFSFSKGVEVAASRQSLKVCHALTWLLVPALRSACKMHQNASAICPHPSQICSSSNWSHLNDHEANFSHRDLSM